MSKEPPPNADTLLRASTAGVAGWITKVHKVVYAAIDPSLLHRQQGKGEGAISEGYK